MAVVLQVASDVTRITVPDGRSYTGDQIFAVSDANFQLIDSDLIGTQLIVIGVGDDPDSQLIVDGLIIVQGAQEQGPQGFQGPIGPQGVQGDRGFQGNQGAQGVQGVQGNAGLQGPQGLLGNLGPQGPQGGAGANGNPGTSIYTGNGNPPNVVGHPGDLYFDKTTRKMFGPKPGANWDLNDNVDLYGFQGNQGTQGTMGTQGFQGDIGPQGDRGNNGPQGIQGSSGSQGSQGDQGLRGFQGFAGPQGNQGFQGNQGSQGNTGTQGAQGLRGFQGFQGTQGSVGSQGPQGHQGNQGAQGAQGSQGTQGPIGNDGPQGTQGVAGTTGNQGPQGNQGLQGYQGAIGPQGYQGNQGFQGLQGIQGTPLTVNGKAGPSVNLYVGDVFADPTTVSLGANGPVTLDASKGHILVSLSANATSSTFSNLTANRLIRVVWKQDATGGRTYVWPALCKFAGAVAPNDTTANRRTSVLFYYDGTNAWEVTRSVAVG